MMLEAIQTAYYQQARNPSELSTLLELAHELNLDAKLFELNLQSAETQVQLEQNLSLADHLGVNSFPSLVLENEHGLRRIQHSYTELSPMLTQLVAG